MISYDLNGLNNLKVDVCVIGSGPVGACLAAELQNRGLSVLVLESGLNRPKRKVQSLSDAVIHDAKYHHPMAISVCRALGGTSNMWGGRCTTLDEVDFLVRDHIRDSGWPFPYRELSGYYKRAAKLIGCPGALFREEDTATLNGQIGFRWDQSYLSS